MSVVRHGRRDPAYYIGHSVAKETKLLILFKLSGSVTRRDVKLRRQHVALIVLVKHPLRQCDAFMWHIFIGYLSSR